MNIPKIPEMSGKKLKHVSLIEKMKGRTEFLVPVINEEKCL